MVGEKYEEEKAKAKAQLQHVEAVSLTSDMWTSTNMDAYLAVTCHFVQDNMKLATLLLGVLPFPQDHTAENIAAAQKSLMVEWGLEGKVQCMVTDAAANMVSTAKKLAMRHVVCIAHALNLVVKKSLDQTPGLDDLRTKARKVVTYFRSSTTGKEKLKHVQQQMNCAVMKLIQEVDTRWNSTFLMLQRLHNERQTVGAALASLKTDAHPLSSEEYETVAACLKVLSPFFAATVELSQEKRVSGSMVIPLVKMLFQANREVIQNTTNITATLLGQNITATLIKKFDNLESSTVLSLATLLDPRFKAIGFNSSEKAQNAVRKLTAECAALVRNTRVETSSDDPSSSAPPQPATNAQNPSSTAFNLWTRLDEDATLARAHRSHTSDATIEVQRYMTDPPVHRSEDPLTYWNEHKHVYPHLFTLAKQYLCITASSVPCERVFSKAGEVVSKKRNRLSPKTVEKLLFLNKNL
ncbi:E3 SUMO-protein ligase ZBED1-like [Solea solea]|uniref:E3 SUMO-protein ligase ZBED1-like n=1 Tax=Solea solea TaxID=90069 RepID=UPI002729C078|nr:E3 SUMO-protein ligase ZBED1-like [Solea solea]